MYYAFDRTALGNGPIWTATIAVARSCLQCGQGSISSSAFDGSTLYVVGGNTTINGTSCKGSLRALKLADGSFVWQACLQGTVMGAGSEVPGVLAVVDGSNLTLVNSGTGVTLFDNSNKFYGSLSILNGVL